MKSLFNLNAAKQVASCDVYCTVKVNWYDDLDGKFQSYHILWLILIKSNHQRHVNFVLTKFVWISLRHRVSGSKIKCRFQIRPVSWNIYEKETISMNKYVNFDLYIRVIAHWKSISGNFNLKYIHTNNSKDVY